MSEPDMPGRSSIQNKKIRQPHVGQDIRTVEQEDDIRTLEQENDIQVILCVFYLQGVPRNMTVGKQF